MGLEKIGAGCMPDRIEIVDKINTGVSGKKVNMNKQKLKLIIYKYIHIIISWRYYLNMQI